MDSMAMFKAKQELNQFLQDHPELRDLQTCIDETLRKAGPDVHNRLAAFNVIVRETARELAHRLTELSSTLKEVGRDSQ